MKRVHCSDDSSDETSPASKQFRPEHMDTPLAAQYGNLQNFPYENMAMPPMPMPLPFPYFMNPPMMPLRPDIFSTPTTSRAVPEGIISPEELNDSGLGSSTSSPDEISPPSKRRCPGEYAKINGRLNLTGNNRQYTVTEDELLRRVNGPEQMNSSTLAAMLRKAKTKDGGSEMRKDLEKHNIRIVTNRRKGTQLNCFSALCEEESLQMGHDLDVLVRTKYPFLSTAQALINVAKAKDPHGQAELQRDLIGCLNIMSHLWGEGGVFANCHVPVAGKTVNPAEKAAATALMGPQFLEKMEEFSMLTHGFGIVNQRTWAGVFQVLMDFGLGLIQKEGEKQLPPNFVMPDGAMPPPYQFQGAFL